MTHKPGRVDNDALPLLNTYKGIEGGWSQKHDTAHMEGRYPAGGANLYADGHVKWVKFDKMVIRTDGTPTFWW